jgi:hypothetical protein
MKDSASRSSLLTNATVWSIAVCLSAPRVFAAVGDVVAPPITPRLPTPYFCAIGVAFDGAWLYVTSCGDPNIYRISTTNGALLATFNPNIPERPAALAFDVKRNGFWVGTQKGRGVTGFGGCCNGQCSGATNEGAPIYFWKPTAPSATFEFLVPWTLANPATGDRLLSSCLIYGLAYREGSDSTDADDELWIADNLSRNIAVFRPSGQFVRGLNAANEEFSLVYRNGLAVENDLVYLTTGGFGVCGDACGDVFRANEVGMGMDILDRLVDGHDRSESDMECDPSTFAPKAVMWVRTDPQGDPANDRITAYEIEPGGCGAGIPIGACCDSGASSCRDVPQAACSGVWTEGVLCSQLDPPCFPLHRIVLLDRTGSMMTVTSDGRTRCERALETVKGEVLVFFNNAPIGSSVAVWTFAGTDPTPLTAGFVGHDAAKQALDMLDPLGCQNLTPLAESICEAVDFVVGTFPAAPWPTLQISISSDGKENNSDGECVGPPSQSGTECPGPNAVDPFQVGSWQEKVCTKIQSNAVFLATYWGPLEILTAAGETDQETGQLRGSGVSDLTFFQALVEATGGNLVVVPDNGPVSGGASSFGVSGACCLPWGECRDAVTQAECASLNGTHEGENSTCNNLPQACVATIPAVSEWGIAVLSLAVLVGGTMVLRRRSAAVA